MSADPRDVPGEVLKVSAPGKRRQWARWPFYRQDGQKATAVPKAFVILALLLFVGGTAASFVVGGDVALPTKSGISLASVAEGPSGQVIVPPAAAAVSQAKEVAKPATTDGKGPTKRPPLPKLQLVTRSSTTQIPPGSMLKARLVSGAANGPLRAEVTEPLVVDGETRIDRGAILLGSGQATEERLFVHFSQVVFADGSFQDIQAQACDMSDQTVGLKGSKMGGYVSKLAAAAALNFAGGLAEGLRSTTVVGGVAISPPSTRDALLNGTATAALQQAQTAMTSAKDTPPMIKVAAGTELLVLTGQGG